MGECPQCGGPLFHEGTFDYKFCPECTPPDRVLNDLPRIRDLPTDDKIDRLLADDDDVSAFFEDSEEFYGDDPREWSNA